VNLKISIFLYVVILLSSGANIGLNTKFTQTVLCPGSKPPKKAASYILFVSLPLWTEGTYFHARVGRRKLMIVLCKNAVITCNNCTLICHKKQLILNENDPNCEWGHIIINKLFFYYFSILISSKLATKPYLPRRSCIL